MRDLRDLDAALARLARSQGALDLAIGETLDRLFRGGRLIRLSYASERDYSLERLGVPVRTMRALLALARGCAGRPLLRKAVAAALVSPCKARAIATVVARDEPGWTAFAMTSTLREIETAVRAVGGEPPADFEAESLRLRMTPAQQDRLEAAFARARETLGGTAPDWQCLEAMCMEWLGEHGEWAPECDEGGARGPELRPKPFAESVAEQLAAIAEAVSVIEDAPETTDPKTLDARALRLLKARQRYDKTFGALTLRLVNSRAWAKLGHGSLAEYCTERLGMSEKSVKERVWLERRMFALPALREALSSGRLSYSKALLVAREATPGNVADLIERAAGTTWQQTEREATAREKRRNRALGVRRLWGPKDAMKTVTDAILSAQAWSENEGKAIDPGEALALIADHFVEVCEAHRARPRTPLRQEVLMRHGGCCAVPGCSRTAAHVHHVRFRSRGGTDDVWNEIGLCAWHHLGAVHRGYLTVEGRAGERLVWRFATGEVFVTYGDDDVRRTDTGQSADCVQERKPPAYGCGAVVTKDVAIGSAA